jgi:hypothetical protein
MVTPIEYFLSKASFSCINDYLDLIDLIDFDGNLKEIPNANNKEYAIQYISPTTNYAIIKIENDPITNEKRYNALLAESKLSGNMISKDIHKTFLVFANNIKI